MGVSRRLRWESSSCWPVCMGSSVVRKVEMSYWPGSEVEMSWRLPLASSRRRVLSCAAEDGGFVGGDDVGRGGLGEVGDEDVTPDGGAVGAGDDVLGVEDVVLEVFVEDAGLNLDGGLAGLGGVFVVEEGLGGAGGDVEGVGQAGDPEADGEDADDADEAEDADAAGAHGGDFAVGCEPTEAEQDADQDGHGDGEGEEAGQQVGDEAKDVEGAGDAAHRELHEREQVAHEQNEGEEHAAEQSVAGDFAEDVASEDAHG